MPRTELGSAHPLQHIEVGGMRPAERAWGSARRLVLISGILSDSRFWEPQPSALDDTFRVTAWDVPGTGGSDDPDEYVGEA